MHIRNVDSSKTHCAEPSPFLVAEIVGFHPWCGDDSFVGP